MKVLEAIKGNEMKKFKEFVADATKLEDGIWLSGGLIVILIEPDKRCTNGTVINVFEKTKR